MTTPHTGIVQYSAWNHVGIYACPNAHASRLQRGLRPPATDCCFASSAQQADMLAGTQAGQAGGYIECTGTCWGGG